MASEPANDTKTPPQQNTNTTNFIVPPEANVFHPTEEEFKDPFQYIGKIRPIAEKTGICKIIPPQNWKPPFSLDVDNFKFSARIQRLNQLDGKTRVKLNFLDQIVQFWELQGAPLIVPEIEERQLNLYDLYKFTREKPHSKMNKSDWIDITKRMGFEPNEDVVVIITECFDKTLLPFIVFNELCEVKFDKPSIYTDVKDEVIVVSDDDDDDDDCIIQETVEEPPDKCTKDIITKQPRVYRELRRLRFLGAGPKFNSASMSKKRKLTKVNYNYDESAEFTICSGCQKTDKRASILICKDCKNKYHFTCIKPALKSLPEGKWHCYKCTSSKVRPIDDFGFEQEKEECTLFEFCEMADKFKKDHFERSLDTISTDDVEQEYWNLTASTDHEVIVKYGADLHTVDSGSGFPTNACTNLQQGDIEYVNSGWNLNNLPVLKRSLLRYINSDVSGMKMPWMYVGMCFATFCWHNEDHWLCSVNYLHWGAPKTWYGVPGIHAEVFEKTMMEEYPELFQSQPDLLHQLVTIMNPNVLMNAGVPVYKTNQNEGEFVITFPRAYHMGFNQGFNFAEAVNYGPMEWYNMGRKSILNYARFKRFCVFSHDELLCSIASSSDKLNPFLATIIYSDMLHVIAREEKLQKDALDDGVVNSQQTRLEQLPDEKRHCEICKTMCYLSAVSCECDDGLVVCLEHYNDLCKCPRSKQVLRYRYTIKEMQALLDNIKSVIDRYAKWLEEVEDALNRDCGANATDLERLSKEAEINDYPDDTRLRKL